MGADDRRRFAPWAEYRRGYSKGLLDAANWIESHTEAIKHHRLNNTAGILAILGCLLESRDALMELGDSLELIVKKDGKKIEVRLADIGAKR